MVTLDLVAEFINRSYPLRKVSYRIWKEELALIAKMYSLNTLKIETATTKEKEKEKEKENEEARATERHTYTY